MTAGLNPLHRFDTMVVGAANRLAVTAAKAVAESPGTVYNPLVIYARPGLGKTHLLMALGHAARAINPRLTVEYLTLDDFVEAFHAAVAAGQGDVYRRRFAEADLLLVDDIQFLARRHETQAELLRLSDALQTSNRQIVLTSDRPPAEIEALDDRLIRRFAGGLIIDVAAPDYETRVAILRRKAEERRAAFAEGVLDAVARLGIDNVRELLGALNRLIAFQAVSDRPLDPGAAARLIDPSGELGGPAAGGAAASGPAPVEVAAERGEDEFGSFLSEIHATVAQQVDAWRGKVTAAVARWEGAGYQVGRLRALLDQEGAGDPEAVLRSYEADVVRLDALRAEASEVDPELARAPAFRNPGDLAAAEALLERARAAAHPPPGPSPQWRIETWIEGAGTRMAVEAARAAIAEPGARYNPLVLTGTAGVGKTHLLHAIGNALAARGDGPVACLGAAEFTDELIAAIDREAVEGWRARYRRCSAFLLDDVHLVAGRDRTQDELFLLFNHLTEAGRQMVFTCVGAPARVEGMEARLRTRLEGGLVVELPVPDHDLRLAVIGRLLAAKLGAADADLAAYLATRAAESVPALHALVRRVLDAADAQGEAVPTAWFARQVLEPAPPEPTRPAPARHGSVVAPAAGGVRSREKMVWEWPNAGDRIIEDWR